MGKDATETNNLILEVIRPYAARLSAFGVFPHRDFQTVCFSSFYKTFPAFFSGNISQGKGIFQLQ